jgi:O-antigen ligase
MAMPMQQVLQPRSLGGATSGFRTPGRLSMATVLKVSLGVLIVGHLGRVPLIASTAKEAPVLLNDLMVVGVVTAGLLMAIRARAMVLDIPAALGLGFAGVGLFALLSATVRFELTAFELMFSAAYLVRWVVYFGIYLVCLNFILPDDRESVWHALENAVLVFAGFGIFQALLLPGFAQMVYPDAAVGTDWDYQGHRLVSTFLDPNFAGALIAMVLLVAIARLAYGAPEPLWRPLLLLLALAMTVSRSSVLGFLAGLAVIAAARGPSRRVLRLLLVSGLLMLPALPFLISYAATLNKFTVDASALARLSAWVRGIEVFADNPIFGVGFNAYGFVQRAYGYDISGASAFGLDGGLLFIAVTTGLVGVALYAGMIAAVGMRCRRTWRDPECTPEQRGLALGVTAATFALVLHSIFVNSIIYPFLMEPLWVMWVISRTGPGAEPVVSGASAPRLVALGGRAA